MVDAISEPLSLIVTYDAFTESAPYDSGEIIQDAATARGVDRLLDLLREHSFALRL